MVARPSEPRISANAGELDRQLAGRIDIKQYYSGGLRFKHIEPVPQSGFRDMGGTVDNGIVRPRMTVLGQSGASQSLGPHTGTQTIWTANVSGTVAAIHVASIKATAGTHSLFCEVFTGGAWVKLGATLPFSTTAIARTIAVAPGAGLSGVSQIRLRVTFASSATITLGAATVFAETATQDRPRYKSLRHDSGDRYFLSATEKWLDIFKDDAFVAGLYLPEITTARLPEVGFYAENATVGIFHRSMSKTIRVRRAGSAEEWLVDDWPYDGIPEVDLGGSYPRTDDVWEVFLRFAVTSKIYISFTVDGEQTEAIPLTDSSGNPVDNTSASRDNVKWLADIKAALEGLPSLGPTVTVTHGLIGDNQEKLVIRFGGELAGREYGLSAQIVNTTSVSALPIHLDVGKTDFEPLFSASKGFPGGASLVQDRLGYFDLGAEPGALSLSQAAEYFNLNIEAVGDNAARLDKLRAGQTAERILAVIDAVYLMVFTDQGVHFAPNRTIKAGEPLNFTLTAATGIVPYTEPVELEQKIYYVAFNDDTDESDGHQILSLVYNELMTSFEAVPESLLASHLVKGIMRTKRQRAAADADASKLWCMRRDGRLVAAQVIKSEEILGLCEWISPAGGLIREIEVDARNRLRLSVERDGMLRHERHDRNIFLHGAITSTSDLAGRVTGLEAHEGREVWAVAEGYTLGPFTVSGGAIELGEHFAGDVLVGLWSPPLYESMPFHKVMRDDTIIVRPGRIPLVHLNIMDTTSIAVGANGQEPRDVTLLDALDPVDAPMPPKTGSYTVSGLLGAKTGTTVVITQKRPGRLRVRDYKIQEAL